MPLALRHGIFLGTTRDRLPFCTLRMAFQQLTRSISLAFFCRCSAVILPHLCRCSSTFRVFSFFEAGAEHEEDAGKEEDEADEADEEQDEAAASRGQRRAKRASALLHVS